ncbi:MAG: glycosyltransferase, partial [Cytophagales bacterium]|nr:glycosyltransferase [Cytophagales bacterium]
MTEPLGQSQVLSYLKRISSQNFKFTIISFEKSGLFEERRHEIEKICKANNIEWLPLKYRSSPPILGIIFGLFQAWNCLSKLNKGKKIDIIHCRGNITPLLGLLSKEWWNVPFIFDMRGWGADEKIESGHWRKWYYLPVYHFFKRMETQYFKRSNKIVSLTYAGRKEIVDRGYALESKVGVIPTCVDFGIFKEFDPKIRSKIRGSLAIP